MVDNLNVGLRDNANVDKASIEGRDHNTGGDSFIWIGDHDDDLQMYIVHSGGPILGPGIHKSPDADLDFIANARQDVPALVAEVRRLRGRLEGGGG